MASIRLRSPVAAVALAAIAAVGAGCNPAPGSSAYKEGTLGNGDFLFACDDGAACLPYTDDAKRFPDAIATGATFDVRFVAKSQQGATITISDKTYEGVKPLPVAPYLSEGPDGFVAKKAGFGTIVVRDAAGTVIDFVSLKIVQPDALIVYDASYDAKLGKDPPQLQKLNLKTDDRSSYRVVAGYAKESVAGSIPVEWTSDDPSVVEIESYSRRVVNVRAVKAGSTTLTASGAGIERKLAVEVSP